MPLMSNMLLYIHISCFVAIAHNLRKGKESMPGAFAALEKGEILR
jgi:hypothetical protein